MRTSSAILRKAFRPAAGVAVAAMAFALWTPAVRAVDGDTPSPNGFHTYEPAPALRLPKLSDITLWKNDMRDGRRAFKAGDFETAREYFDRALDNGNFKAAWYLGHIHRLGLSVERDPARAVRYYSMLANRYHPDEPRAAVFRLTVDSMVHLANYYRDGAPDSGIRKDSYRAFDLYNLAASHGHPAGHFGLAVMYLRGDGVKRSPRRALRWLMVAANRHYAPAKALLGDLFWGGEVVRRDRVEGLKWYVLAIQTARADLYPDIYNRLDKLLAESSEEERTSAELLAAEWTERNPVPGDMAIIAPVSGTGE